MMIVKLFGSARMAVSDDEGHVLMDQLQSAKPPRYVRLHGQLVILSEVTGVFDREEFEQIEHDARGDWQCAFGFWHGKRDECQHTEIKPIAQPVSRSGKKPMEAWQYRVLSLNSKAIAAKEFGVKIGLLKTKLELETYEKTGQWPEYLPLEKWREIDARYDHPPLARETRTAWIRQLVSERQYVANYAGRPGYRVLEHLGSDVVIAYRKPLSAISGLGEKLEPGKAYCSAEEIRRLEP